jgi:hypothetical protein
LGSSHHKPLPLNSVLVSNGLWVMVTGVVNNREFWFFFSFYFWHKGILVFFCFTSSAIRSLHCFIINHKIRRVLLSMFRLLLFLSSHFLFNQTRERRRLYFSLFYFSYLSLKPNNLSNLFYFLHFSLFWYSLLPSSLISISSHCQAECKLWSTKYLVRLWGGSLTTTNLE